MEKKNLSAEMAAAAAEAARVVGNVLPEGTLDAPTPCGDWDLRTLLNHTILWTAYSAERRAHGESVAEDLMNKDFTADPGFREDYARQIGKAVTAWSAPRGLGRHRNVMGDATPAADVGAMLLMETALHGWDVARATGQEFSDRRANGQSPGGHRPGPGRTLPQVPGLRRRRRTAAERDGLRTRPHPVRPRPRLEASVITTRSAPAPANPWRTPRCPRPRRRRRPGRSPR